VGGRYENVHKKLRQRKELSMTVWWREEGMLIVSAAVVHSKGEGQKSRGGGGAMFIKMCGALFHNKILVLILHIYL
jgi:hypothetical protein